ncbi:hypothetical protein SHIRM173S_12792 [Streptomyces hirsutus]
MGSGDIRAVRSCTRAASSPPPACPISPPSTTHPGSSSAATDAAPTATRSARASRKRASAEPGLLPRPCGGRPYRSRRRRFHSRLGHDPAFPRQFRDRRRRRKGVEAAAAVRGRRQAGRARDRQEADLTRAAGGAPAQGAVQDHGRAGAVAEPQQDEGVAVAGGPVALLGQGGEVGLVLRLTRASGSRS